MGERRIFECLKLTQSRSKPAQSRYAGLSKCPYFSGESEEFRALNPAFWAAARAEKIV